MASLVASGTRNVRRPTTSGAVNGEGEGEGEGDTPEGRGEGLAVREAFGVPVPVSVAVAEPEAQAEPEDSEEVPDGEGRLEAETVHEHMQEQKAVCVGRMEKAAEVEPLPLREGCRREELAVGELDLDAQTEGLAVIVRCVSVAAMVTDCAEEGVSASVGRATDGSGEDVGAPVGGEPVCEIEGVNEPEALPEGLVGAVFEEQAVGLVVGVPHAVEVEVAELEPVIVEEGLVVALAVTVALPVEVSVALPLEVADLSLALADGVALPLDVTLDVFVSV